MTNQTEHISNKLKIWLPLLFSFVLVLGMLIGVNLKQPTVVAIKEQIPIIRSIEPGRVEELLRYVEAKYVDDINRDELTEKAIGNLLNELDPHSNYISAKQLKEVNEQLEGNFEGIGIEFMIMDDTILVVTPIAGGPSEAVGILSGDRIVEISDSIVAGKDIVVKDVIGMLRGSKGTEVKVGVLRKNAKEIKHFTITRDKIPLNSVDIGYMLDEKTGYVRISRFSASTYREFMQELEDLVTNQQMEDLVIDLRQNPGGYLLEATNILSQLFDEKGKLLVYTEGRTVKRNNYESTGKAFYNIGSIAVLIDEGSASASEIIAGAIQDWDRGTIIGRRSFGKGLVQEQYVLKDGGALRLTIARYYTPSGRSIQKSYEDFSAYDHDVIDRREKGELYSADSMLIADTTKYYTLSENRVVYGGGGIQPDIFIPLDTIFINDHFLELRRELPNYIYRLVEDHKKDFNYNIKEFLSFYAVTDNAFNDFLTYCESRGIAKKKVRNSKAFKDAVKLVYKAQVAKQLFGDEGFYIIWNQNDPAVQKALETFKKSKATATN